MSFNDKEMKRKKKEKRAEKKAESGAKSRSPDDATTRIKVEIELPDDLDPPPAPPGESPKNEIPSETENEANGDVEEGGRASRSKSKDKGHDRKKGGKGKRKAMALTTLQGGSDPGTTRERVKSTRNVKDTVKNTFSALSASRFEKWTNEELILLLIQGGVEVRGESTIAHSTLVGLVDSYYEGKDMPDKVPPYSQAQLEKIEWIICKIQNHFIELCAARRAKEEKDSRDQNNDDDDIDAQAYKDFDLADALAQTEADNDDDADYSYEDNREGSMHNFANPIKLSKAGRSYERMRTSSNADDSETFRDTEYDFGDGDIIDPKMMRLRRSPSSDKSKVRILDIPWHIPSWEKANDHMNYNRPRQGGKGGKRFHFKSTTTGRHCTLGGCGEMCDIFREGQVSEFGIYGPGVTNYFKFIKWLFWLFFILSIIAIPELIVNLTGPYQSAAGLTDLMSTTAGNLAPKNTNQTVTVSVPLCPFAQAVSTALYGQYFDCDVSRNSMGRFYAGFDVLICLIVLAAFMWVRVFEKKEELLLDKNTVFASMYTLQIKNLPEVCTEHKLKHHLIDVLRCRARAIVAVNFALDNHDEFQLCVERGKCIKERTRMINLHRYETTRIRNRYKSDADRKAGELSIKAKRKGFINSCMAVDTKLKGIDSKLQDLEKARRMNPCRPIVAYVTFETIDDVERCLHVFGQKKSVSSFMGSARHVAADASTLPIDGKKLKFNRAPEPSTIIWENLRFSFKERILRRTITTFLALLLILVSVVCTYTAKVLQDRSTTSSGTVLCPSGFNGLTKTQQQEAVEADSSILHCYCDNLSYSQKGIDSTCRSYYQQQLITQLVTYFASIIVLIVSIFMEFVMQAFSNLEKHQSEDTAYRSVFLRLFALKYINTSAGVYPSPSIPSPILSTRCISLTPHTPHPPPPLVFLINSNIQWLLQIFGTSGNSTEFSADWYKTVGVSIILVQIGSIATSHAKKLWDYYRYRSRIRTALRRQDSDHPTVLTQDELNKLHEGPSFEFSINYAQLMTTFFVCLTFSAGMPILYVIAMINFGTTYLLDKYLFVNLYKTPNRYSTKIGREATALVPWGVVMHLLLAIWALSYPVIFSALPSSEAQLILTEKYSPYSSNKHRQTVDGQGLTTATLAHKIYYEHTFPLFLLVVGIIFLRFSAWLFSNLGYASGRFLGLIFDGGDGEVPRDSVANAVNYSRAVQRNLIKGATPWTSPHSFPT